MSHLSVRRVMSAVVIVVAALTASTAAAAPVVDVTAFGDQGTAKTTVATTAFSTSAGNELILAFIATDALSGANTTVTSVAGAGLTWQLVRRTNVQLGTSEIWRAFTATALANVTVTATLSRAVSSSITVMAFSGVDTSGANGSGAIGATASNNAAQGTPTATLTATRAGSIVVGVGNDYDNAVNRAVPAGQSLVHQYLSPVGDTYWVQRLSSPVASAGTGATISDTAPSGDRFNLTICEVLTGTGGSGGDTTPPTVSITAPATGSVVSGTVTVSATAADNTGVVGVQLILDGTNLGAEDTVSPYSFSWNTTTTADGSHVLTALTRDAAGNQATSVPVSVTVGNAPSASIVGQWSAPFELGMVAVNAVLLRTGKILMFEGQYVTSGSPILWDPTSGGITPLADPHYNIFCAGQAQLADGRILVAGGYDPSSLGAPNATIFDPGTSTWSAAPNMTYRRWYPTATTLPDGRIILTSGAQSCDTCLADVPEIYNPTTNKWTALNSARLGVPYYPFVYVLPNGKVMDAGANQQSVASRTLDLQTGTWSAPDQTVADGHSSAMYLPGRILKTGTAADSGTNGTAASTAYVIDMNQATPTWRQVPSMAFRRAFHNTTILADGTVLVTGGMTGLNGYDGNLAVRDAELWSPVTETWQTLAKAQFPRLYHSTALLLPDGRVFNAGGGDDGPAVNYTQAQVFSPPYLFKGARPTLTVAPATLQYGAPFTVQTPDAASIRTVSLIRPGSVTHAFDEDQRYLSLSFTASAGSLSVQAPASGNLAPPGYYMLFLVNNAGVPSVAQFVRLPSPSEDAIPPSAPLSLNGQGGIGTATLSWTASTDNNGVALYNIHRSATPGFLPTSANRIGQSAATSFIDRTVAGTYAYLVTAQDVAGNVSQPSNEVAVSIMADTTPPTVSMTAPADGATVTGTAAVSSDASDDVAVSGVQFLLDGASLGAERTAPPYSISWNSAGTPNGTHMLSAKARDAAGNVTQATAVLVNVLNQVTSAPGLVAAYGFDEGSGVQTADATGQGNAGTLGGATWTPNGKFGSALSFDGATSWVTVADAATLRLTGGFTVEAWVNPSANTGWRSVILKESSNGFGYALYALNNASRPAGYVHTNSDIAVTGTAALPLNSWTHLALSFDGSTERLYVNGTQVRTGAVTGAMVSASGALRIGGNSIWGEYFRGLIDEVRIYNRALAASEIQTDMSLPIH